jgi:hypothetical protein
MSDHAAEIEAATRVLDDFMAAFNARDIDAWQKTFNFPSVRLASNTMVIIDKDYHQPGMFDRGALAEWDHSAWERRNIIHAAPTRSISTPASPATVRTAASSAASIRSMW